MATTLDQVVFVGFNSRVVALDQNSGAILWAWECPMGTGYVSMLVTDERHLIVSVNGYTYCLDPATGGQIWFNELAGHGVGVPTLAAWGVHSGTSVLLPAADAAAQAAQADVTN